MALKAGGKHVLGKVTAPVVELLWVAVVVQVVLRSAGKERETGHKLTSPHLGPAQDEKSSKS